MRYRFDETLDNDHALFNINADGQISLKVAGTWDYESNKKQYVVEVIASASDGEGGTDEARAQITFAVQNVQEGPAEYEITDNSGSLSVALVDADPTSATYSEDPDGVDGNVSFQWFTTDGTTHTLITGANIGENTDTLDISDRPVDESYGVFIIYRDGFGTTYTHTDNDDDTTIVVLASTVHFTSTPSTPIEVAEGTNIVTATLGANSDGVLASVTAESSEDESVTYALTATGSDGSDASSLFSVNNVNNRGEISFASASVDLDFETIGQYTLIITASAPQEADSTVMDTNNAIVIINVSNEQDGPAEYEITDNNGSLSVALVDADPTSATYSEDPDGVDGNVSFQWFTTDGTTHTLITGANIGENTDTLDISDRPVDESYGVFVIYRDGFGTTYTHTDNDDDTTIVVLASTVHFTSTPSTPIEVAEGTNIVTTTLGANGDGVLASVTAQSSEDESVTYALTATGSDGSDASSLFSVNNRGAISFASSSVDLDFETIGQYTLIITASAPQEADSTVMDTNNAIVIINVSNEQDGPAEYEITDNNGSLSVALVDADPTSATYSEDPDGVDGNVSFQWFTTDGTTHTLITGANIGENTDTLDISDRPVDESYGVFIIYRDGFGTTYTHTDNDDDTTIAVLANSVFFSEGDQTIDRIETLGEGGSIASVSASGEGTISYSFANDGNPDGKFAIDTTSGVITLDTGERLDYETEPTHTIKIVATDATTGDTRPATIIVNVQNVDDSDSEFAPLQIASPAIAGFGTAALAGATVTAGADTLTGTAGAEYINGDAGGDTITSGGGADHILGGAGTDGITLSSAAGSVETIYYRFSSAGTGAWVGSDGVDTITNFRFGEDRLVLIDTNGVPIDLATFTNANNLNTAGGRVQIKPIVDTSLTTSTGNTRYGDSLDGVEIIFGSNKIRIEYETSTRPLTYDQADGDYTSQAETFFGPIQSGVPSKLDANTGLLTDNTLLAAYFGSGTHTNLQVVDDSYLETIVPDVLISESRASTAGVFATVSATDADVTPNNQVSYSITDGTGMGVFDLDANGGISVASAAILDYETTSSYTLTIGVSDGLDADGMADPAVDATKTFTIGLVANLPAEYRIVRQFPEGGPLLKAEIVTPDPDGVMAGTAASYRFFLLNSDGSEPVASEANYNLQDATFSHTNNDTLLLRSDFNFNNVYGVEVTYTDGVGKQESVVFIEAPQPQAPPIQPSRQWEQVEVIIPDDLGLTPLPEVDPNAG